MLEYDDTVKLVIGKKYDKDIYVPNHIKYLVIKKFKHKIINLPENLEVLDIREYDHQIPKLPQSLFAFGFWKCNFSNLELPPKLIAFSIIHNRGQIFPKLPNSVKYITIGGKFNEPIIFPQSLRAVGFVGGYEFPFTLNDNIKSIHIERYDEKIVDLIRLPKALKYFDCLYGNENKYYRLLLSCYGVIKIYYPIANKECKEILKKHIQKNKYNKKIKCMRLFDFI